MHTMPSSPSTNANDCLANCTNSISDWLEIQIETTSQNAQNIYVMEIYITNGTFF